MSVGFADANVFSAWKIAKLFENEDQIKSRCDPLWNNRNFCCVEYIIKLKTKMKKQQQQQQ